VSSGVLRDCAWPLGGWLTAPLPVVKVQIGPARLRPPALVTVMRHSYSVFGSRFDIAIDATDWL
jgi:hypothetical protein